MDFQRKIARYHKVIVMDEFETPFSREDTGFIPISPGHDFKGYIIVEKAGMNIK